MARKNNWTELQCDRLIDKALAGKIGRLDMMTSDGKYIVVIAFDIDYLCEAEEAVQAIVKERDG